MTADAEKAIQAAQGYCDLDMVSDAWAELETVSPTDRSSLEFLHIQVVLLLKEENWTEALEVSEELCSREPVASGGFIHAAFCLHELGNTHDARRKLLEGPESLRNEPIFYYNLGCYEAKLGDLLEARRLLKRSFELDEKLLEVAKKDPDLETLWTIL